MGMELKIYGVKRFKVAENKFEFALINLLSNDYILDNESIGDEFSRYCHNKKLKGFLEKDNILKEWEFQEFNVLDPESVLEFAKWFKEYVDYDICYCSDSNILERYAKEVKEQTFNENVGYKFWLVGIWV